MSETPRPIWNSPVAGAVVAAFLAAFGTYCTERATSAGTTGAMAARIEVLEAREHDIENRYVTKDEFEQFLAQIADMKGDLREIKESLSAHRRE
jgi:hypothetical protein